MEAPQTSEKITENWETNLKFEVVNLNFWLTNGKDYSFFQHQD